MSEIESPSEKPIIEFDIANSSNFIMLGFGGSKVSGDPGVAYYFLIILKVAHLRSFEIPSEKPIIKYDIAKSSNFIVLGGVGQR